MLCIFFLLSLSLLHGALGKLVCEQLPVAMCSYAIASSGKRCLLETSSVKEAASSKGSRLYCKTSNATANHVMNEYIETDSCINACGVDRMAVGISSDNLLDSRFSRKLCTSRCLNNCPNIADLYHNLAIGEGMYLPDLCSRVMYGSSRRAFLSNLAVEPKSRISSSSAESDEVNLAAEPEPPLSESEDEDEIIAAAPEASPLFEHDRVHPDDSAAAAPEAAVLPGSPDEIGERRLSSGSIRFKVAATPV